MALCDHVTPDSMLNLRLPDEQTPPPRLPTLTSANDLRDFVQYVKRKSAGVVAAEELDRSRKRLFEEHKLAAYRSLGITQEKNGLLTLSPLGWELARRLEPGTEGFRQLLNRIPTYTAAIRWMHEENFEVVTLTDLLAFWPSFCELDEREDPEAMRGAAISLFSLCEAAELGTLTLGKRGHITRLRVDHEQLRKFVASDSPKGFSGADVFNVDDHQVHDRKSLAPVTKKQHTLRMLVVKNGDTAIVDLIRRTLEITEVDSLWIDRDWRVENSIADDLAHFANDYDALLLILDEASLSEFQQCSSCTKKRLLEIGAALKLFELRVVLGDKEIEMPEDIHELAYHQFEKNSMSWAEGLELINTIETFKTRVNA